MPRRHALVVLDRRLAGALAACALAACLPAGDPPAGSHLFKGRTLSGVFLVPSTKQGVPSRVFASGSLRSAGLEGPLSGEALVDLYSFDGEALADPADEIDSFPPIDSLLPVIVGMQIPGADPIDHVLASDAFGRLIVVRATTEAPLVPGEEFGVWRFDPSVRSMEWLAYEDLASVSFQNPDARLGPRPFLLSPGGRQLLVGGADVAWIWGPTSSRALSEVRDPVFLDEALYCAGKVGDGSSSALPASDILRVGLDGDIEVLGSSTGRLGLTLVAGPLAPQLVVSLVTEQGRRPYSLLDTVTHEEKLLPPERNQGASQAEFLSASTDGRLLVFRNIVTPANTTEPADYRLFIYDWPTEQFVAITSAWTGRRIVGTAEWRPGTHELWFDLDSDGFAIWKPGNEMVVLDGSLFPYQEALGRASAFTRDGRHWFSRSPGVRSSVSVGMADDPTAPLLQLHPSGTQSDRYWTVDDGRLLVEAWSVDERRSDLHLVDADARTTRAMGNAGRVVAVGQGRALALLNWQSARSSGELTLIELASGHRRMLGADVYAVAVDREASDGVRIPTDTLAPGARVAFLIRNRLESRDDGLWVATLP